MIESEKVLERKLREEIEQRGGMCIKLLSTHQFGLPDRMCLLPNGRLFFAEIKTTGKKPTKIQLFIHNRLRALGFLVFVVDCTEMIKNALKSQENDGF